MKRDDLMLARFIAERPEWQDMYAEGPEAWKLIENTVEYAFWRFGAECGELWKALGGAVVVTREAWKVAFYLFAGSFVVYLLLALVEPF